LLFALRTGIGNSGKTLMRYLSTETRLCRFPPRLRTSRIDLLQSKTANRLSTRLGWAVT